MISPARMRRSIFAKRSAAVQQRLSVFRPNGKAEDLVLTATGSLAVSSHSSPESCVRVQEWFSANPGTVIAVLHPESLGCIKYTILESSTA